MLAEPWSDRRFSPFFGIGVGRFCNLPNAAWSAPSRPTRTWPTRRSGRAIHIGDRFVARLDYTIFTTYLSDTRTSEYWQ